MEVKNTWVGDYKYCDNGHLVPPEQEYCRICKTLSRKIKTINENPENPKKAE